MPCSGKRCVAAIKYALDGSEKEARLAKKMCGYQDLIGLIRSQMSLDRADNLAQPGTQTQGLAGELVRQIDAEGCICLESDAACTPVGTPPNQTTPNFIDPGVYYSALNGNFDGTDTQPNQQIIPATDPGEWFMCMNLINNNPGDAQITLYINCTDSTIPQVGPGLNPVVPAGLTSSNLVVADATNTTYTLTVTGVLSLDLTTDPTWDIGGGSFLSYSNYNVLAGGDVSAADAVRFGVYRDVNCRRVCCLLQRCDGTTLGAIAGGTVLYADGPEEFLCCLADHFARIQRFFEAYVRAKSCQSLC